MSANRYAKMSTEDFDRLLADVIDENPASHLLAVAGVYELLAEEFNNAVLEAWDAEQEPTDLDDGDPE